MVLDEAHERTVHTDVLFGVVKSAQRRRKSSTNRNISPLQVIFTAGRCFEVTVCWVPRRQIACKKTRKIVCSSNLQRQPEGDRCFERPVLICHEVGTRKPSCDCELLMYNLDFELDLDNFKMSRCIKYRGQRSVVISAAEFLHARCSSCHPGRSTKQMLDGLSYLRCEIRHVHAFAAGSCDVGYNGRGSFLKVF